MSNDAPHHRASYSRAANTERRQLGCTGEVLLALLPTVFVLAVLALLEAYSRQRILFASLASSAFLIYLDPQHQTNTIRTLVIAHVAAASSGLLLALALGPGYLVGGGAMIITIGVMIALDAVHQPAVSTALTLAFHDDTQRTVVLFGLALAMVILLVVLERAMVAVLKHLSARVTARQQ